MKEIGRLLYSIFLYMLALLVSTAAMTWLVSDTLAWSFVDSWSVMLSVFIGIIFYGVYDDYMDYKRSEWRLADKRERAKNDFLDYHNKA